MSTQQPAAPGWSTRTVADEIRGAIVVAASHARQHPDQAAAVIASTLRDLDEVEREWLARLVGVFQRRHRRFHDQGWCRCDHELA